MIYLAKKQKTVSVKEISEKEKIPLDFLEKIVLRLKKANLISAKKGPNGGYILAKKPHEIKVSQIIDALGEKEISVPCLFGICLNSKKCLAKKFWEKLNKVLNKFLNSITLAELIKK